MNKMKTLLVLVMLLLLMAGTALAQDVTREPGTEPAATVEAPVTTPDTQPSADPAITLKWWQVIAGLFTAAAGGGLIGIAGFGVLATRIKNDAATMKAIEGLTESVPANVVKAILETARSTQAIADVVEEAFDGIPAASKVSPPVSAQSAG